MPSLPQTPRSPMMLGDRAPACRTPNVPIPPASSSALPKGRVRFRGVTGWHRISPFPWRAFLKRRFCDQKWLTPAFVQRQGGGRTA
jgi:hypothetical protein